MGKLLVAVRQSERRTHIRSGNSSVGHHENAIEAAEGCLRRSYSAPKRVRLSCASCAKQQQSQRGRVHGTGGSNMQSPLPDGLERQTLRRIQIRAQRAPLLLLFRRLPLLPRAGNARLQF